MDRFSWRSYDMGTALPPNWQNDVLTVARTKAVKKVLLPRSVTSREGDPNLQIPVSTVGGAVLRGELPWLFNLYKGLFRDLAQLGTHEPVSTAASDQIGANLNVQTAGMRYEAHVDSNPVEGLLYCTDHPKGSGGELVVANDPNAKSIAEIDRDCSIVYPAAGNLIFFDARRFPHYVRPLVAADAIRVVVAMNFYTPSCPESSRPADLNDHLFGYKVELKSTEAASDGD
jgi:hypothetical protein